MGWFRCRFGHFGGTYGKLNMHTSQFMAGSVTCAVLRSSFSIQGGASVLLASLRSTRPNWLQTELWRCSLWGSGLWGGSGPESIDVMRH